VISLPQKVSIRIDGEFVTARDDQHILEVARASGKYIPALCYMQGLSTVGACRLCIVEVAGVNRLLPACTTPVQDGMSVTTNSKRLESYRRMAVELLLAERNHICAVCVSNNHCELQSLAQKLGVTNTRFTYSYPRLSVDQTHNRFVLDHNRCILCTRCVRVCDEIEGAHVLDVCSRGVGSRIICELNRPWGESKNCTSCGKCVQVCPTGALAEKGWSTEEMVKFDEKISRLAARRGAHQ
jgi:bidirectional [NiFe] hydrogenase diaphorase subunit